MNTATFPIYSYCWGTSRIENSPTEAAFLKAIPRKGNSRPWSWRE